MIPLKISKKPTLILTLILAATGLVIANILVSASLSTSGEKVKQLEQKKQQLTEENQQLQLYILKNSSLTLLEEKAKALEFILPENIVTITQTAPVALSPKQ